MAQSSKSSKSSKSSGASEPDERRSPDLPTPDRKLHSGGDRPIEPEDLVRLSGREPTPELIEKARQALEEEGAAAVERYLP
ncbi:hypothetical protein [Streptomyces litchfieldiae]|uniref:Uncharacterized protein n=1 Tax=Streptomyces litchfieldiae TaxID=3075543 RepID=A0ABU2MZE7_9ACTN|nr:hypothetical protein [Streptomyces sp. DSM 44938]MDT0347028.1 hypothetical protein [Streptomyces sp. DSM 44938]